MIFEIFLPKKIKDTFLASYTLNTAIYAEKVIKTLLFKSSLL
jgi:hypothetical protein